jgi:hypothetical protein
VADESWYHTDSYVHGERPQYTGKIPHTLSPEGPVPADAKWSVTLTPADNADDTADGKLLVQEVSVAIEVNTTHPDYGAAYPQPTGLADLEPFHAQLTEMLGQLAGIR